MHPGRGVALTVNAPEGVGEGVCPRCFLVRFVLFSDGAGENKIDMAGDGYVRSRDAARTSARERSSALTYATHIFSAVWRTTSQCAQHIQRIPWRGRTKGGGFLNNNRRVYVARRGVRAHSVELRTWPTRVFTLGRFCRPETGCFVTKYNFSFFLPDDNSRFP